MDSRKVSSLSVKSDGSDSSLPRGSNLILEEIGSIPISEVNFILNSLFFAINYLFYFSYNFFSDLTYSIYLRLDIRVCVCLTFDI